MKIFTFLRGVQFRNAPNQRAFYATPNGSELKARREHDNAKDPNAIALFAHHEGTWWHIGYVARETARNLWYQVDLEHDITITVKRKYYILPRKLNCAEIDIEIHDPKLASIASNWDVDNYVNQAPYPFG